LNVQTGNLTAQVNSLTGIVSDLRKQLADAGQRLTGATSLPAGTPIQGAAAGGTADKSSDASLVRFLQAPWPDVAVPTTLFLLLCALLGTMIIGMPVRALLYRVPRRQVAEPQIPRALSREGMAARIDPH
jgi:hypothetical protein